MSDRSLTLTLSADQWRHFREQLTGHASLDGFPATIVARDVTDLLNGISRRAPLTILPMDPAEEQHERLVHVPGTAIATCRAGLAPLTAYSSATSGPSTERVGSLSAPQTVLQSGGFNGTIDNMTAMFAAGRLDAEDVLQN